MKYFYKFDTVAEYTSSKPGLPTNHVAMINGEIYTNTVSGSGTDFSDYYTKQEIDNKGFLTSSSISGKADASSVYTKTEIDTKLGNVESLLSAL